MYECGIFMGLKKKIILCWLALELAALPFAIPTAAKIFQNTTPEPIARVASVDIPAQAGLTRILLAADGPFVIIASEAMTDIETRIHITGEINGNAYGKLAQHPGADNICAHPTNTNEHIIYRSERKTADNIGPILDQAIIVDISYNATQHPKFRVETITEYPIATAPACSA